ncbi:TetR/AcrR family transcriptional regulator [Domibacillus sp. A3M-37]|uniref:TetR/AcrR family transcriptional regulator n=1 Tax=Domibacillus sp. A3M-37 TaxID=2962037 RepID=UPI0020B7566A|nr:TetR/AcrR family transcriptional regulator [Domibacillus sp. A3M-37]MCP3762695.1 TetR/AcrR family transcriptional regulator [Domibacillus sp. A3M-37]
MKEKKRKILLTAMKLFSKTSFHQTSMQQIADVCGLSKGSLYTYFKSKEELLSDIFTYYYQMLHDQIAAAKDESDSLQEDFIREIAIRTRHYCAFQEFFMMQLKEIRGLEDPSLNEFVRRENFHLIKQTEKRIITMYGEEIAPYAADLTVSLKGLMISYLREIIERESRQDFDQLAHYLFKHLDASSKWMLDEKPEPIFSSHLDKREEPQCAPGIHPLHFIKKLKEMAVQEKASAFVLDSITILEKELLDVKPRTAILNGMLFNLKSIPSMKPLAEELEQAVQKMPETIHL